MPEEITSNEIPGTIQTVGVLVFNENHDRILMVKHTGAAQNEEGIYGIPAGRIELGESPKEAAKRELFEETGLVTYENSLEQFKNNFFGADLVRTKTGELRHGQMRVYHCKLTEGKLKSDEKTIPEWVELETVKKWTEEDEGKEIWEKKHLMPNIQNAIDNYLESNKRGEYE